MREKTVLTYLRSNPGFLRRHQSELTRMLRLAERDVVDLTGQQIVTLRDENTKLRRQLHSWYQAAADNEQIINFLHRYALMLVSGGTKDATKKLTREIDKQLGIKLCKVVDFEKDKVILTTADKKRINESVGVLQTLKPLESFKKLVKVGHWDAFLHIPVHQGKKLRAVIICATQDASDFPNNAEADYAIRLSELVAAALGKK